MEGILGREKSMYGHGGRNKRVFAKEVFQHNWNLGMWRGAIAAETREVDG